MSNGDIPDFLANWDSPRAQRNSRTVPKLRAVWALSDLPLEVVRLLQNSRDGGIADRDQPFNVSDAVREHCHSED